MTTESAYAQCLTTVQEFKALIDRYHTVGLDHHDKCTVAAAAIIAARHMQPITFRTRTDENLAFHAIVDWCKAMDLAGFEPHVEGHPTNGWGTSLAAVLLTQK